MSTRDKRQLLLMFSLALLTLGVAETCQPERVGPSAQPPQPRSLRVVSLLPNATEILFDLGVGDQIVGVTRYCDRPAAAKAILRVGGILDPSLETVLGASPTVVIGSSKVLGVDDGGRFATLLTAAGAKLVPLNFETMEDVETGILAIGEAIGRPDSASQLAKRFHSEVGALEGSLRRSPPVKTLLIVGKNPLVVAGPNSFLGGLFGAMGLDNVVESGEMDFPTWSLEQVFVADPDLVIDAVLQEGGVSDTLTSAGVRAGRAGRIVRLPDNGILRPGPAMIEASWALVAEIKKVL